MTVPGRLALCVSELEKGEFHYSLLEAVTVPGELLCFRPRETGETAHSTPMGAWFEGVGVVRKLGKTD
ncbi:hypothetical protein J7E62_31645 [Variovorax paradoxus]|nr:hypothetical protein [Variovorax paradoxus]